MKENKKKYFAVTLFLDSTADVRFNRYMENHSDYQIKFITAAGGNNPRVFIIFEVEDTDE